MNQLPHFEKGQILTADELNAVIDYIKMHTVSVGPGLTMEQSPSGTVISAMQQQQLRKSMIASSRTRFPFEICVKTNAEEKQTVHCDGNVAEQHYEVVDKNGGAEIELTGWRQFGVANSRTIEKGFAGTLYFYLRHNQTGATGTGIVIKDNGNQGDNELFIGNIKFDGEGGYKITQVWIGGYSFVRIDPNQIPQPQWSNCPRYNSHNS